MAERDRRGVTPRIDSRIHELDGGNVTEPGPPVRQPARNSDTVHPTAPIVVRPPAETSAAKGKTAYVGACDVVDATNFASIAQQVGNRVEIVGRVTKIHAARTKYGLHPRQRSLADS